jgi:hypothetical protein
MNRLMELLKQLARERFYGGVQLDFKAGEIILVRKEQTLKLDNGRTYGNLNSNR